MASHARLSSYDVQREKLAAYFDGTARKAWIDLTSDAKVSGVRATVRAGREEMRETLLEGLPEDLRRARVLDAGCGTGAMAAAVALRGAQVVAIDIAEGLVEIARERQPAFIGHGTIDWRVGDMLDPALGTFDHMVAMDSLIHYPLADIVRTLSDLSTRTAHSMLFTFAPHTRMLGAMHRAGKLFPRSDRSPAIQPVSEDLLRAALGEALPDWRIASSQRISRGFYTSQAMRLERAA